MTEERVSFQGFHDGENDGPKKDEKLTGPNDPDIIWEFDMMEEVGAFPHNLAMVRASLFLTNSGPHRSISRPAPTATPTLTNMA